MSDPMTDPIRRSDSEIRSGVPLTNLLTHLRTNGDLWLSPRDHLTFRNARAHIRISRLAGVSS